MVPILMYHQVTDGGPDAYVRYTVAPAAFARQMRVLAAFRYRTISLDQLLAARTSGTPLPKRSVVITFDDGFRDAIRYAVPILREHGFTATFFVVAALIGRTSEWTRRKRGIEMALADANMLRECAAEGFTIGSHALNHRPLADLQENESRYELSESKRRLEEALGCDVHHLAYPHGSTNERVRQTATECGYRTACTIVEGMSAASDDLMMLRRIPVEGGDSLMDFVWRVRTGHPFGRVAQRVRVSMKVSDFAR